MERRARQAGGLDANGIGVAAHEGVLEAGTGAEQPAPAPAPRSVDVVRERDGEARVPGIGGRGLDADRLCRLAQREHDVVERGRARLERGGRGREAPVLVRSAAQLLRARQRRRRGAQIPRRIERDRRRAVGNRQAGRRAELAATQRTCAWRPSGSDTTARCTRAS